MMLWAADSFFFALYYENIIMLLAGFASRVYFMLIASCCVAYFVSILGRPLLLLFRKLEKSQRGRQICFAKDLFLHCVLITNPLLTLPNCLLNMIWRIESDKTGKDKSHDDCSHCEREESEIKSLLVVENVHHFLLLVA